MGNYKDMVGDGKCFPCPAQSNATEAGQDMCPCFEGYFRAPEENASVNCTSITPLLFSCILCTSSSPAVIKYPMQVRLLQMLHSHKSQIQCTLNHITSICSREDYS